MFLIYFQSASRFSSIVEQTFNRDVMRCDLRLILQSSISTASLKLAKKSFKMSVMKITHHLMVTFFMIEYSRKMPLQNCAFRLTFPRAFYTQSDASRFSYGRADVQSWRHAVRLPTDASETSKGTGLRPPPLNQKQSKLI